MDNESETVVVSVELGVVTSQFRKPPLTCAENTALSVSTVLSHAVWTRIYPKEQEIVDT